MICLIFLYLEIEISGNVSVYPGETATFTCELDTQGIGDVTFQWVRTDGMTDMFLDESLDMEASGIGSTQDYNFISTFNVTNVNYTDDNVGFYCNASGCNASMTAYLTGNCISESVC